MARIFRYFKFLKDIRIFQENATGAKNENLMNSLNVRQENYSEVFLSNFLSANIQQLFLRCGDLKMWHTSTRRQAKAKFKSKILTHVNPGSESELPIYFKEQDQKQFDDYLNGHGAW